MSGRRPSILLGVLTLLVVSCSAGPGSARPTTIQSPAPRLADPALVPAVLAWAERFSAGDLAGALRLVRPDSPAAVYTRDKIASTPNAAVLRLTRGEFGLWTLDSSLLSDFIADAGGLITTFDRNRIHVEQLLAVGDGRSYATADGAVTTTTIDFWYFDGDLVAVFEVENAGPRTALLTLDSYTKDGRAFAFGYRNGLAFAGTTATLWTVVDDGPPGGRLVVTVSAATSTTFTVDVPAPI